MLQSIAMPFCHPTKMGRKEEEAMHWKEEAERLFFISKFSINEIAERLKKSRRSIQGHLSGLPGYRQEKRARMAQRADGRKEYKRQWDREHRLRGSEVTADTIRREHDMAALILSHEKYG